jgi:hypothetical protein
MRGTRTSRQPYGAAFVLTPVALAATAGVVVPAAPAVAGAAQPNVVATLDELGECADTAGRDPRPEGAYCE